MSHSKKHARQHRSFRCCACCCTVWVTYAKQDRCVVLNLATEAGCKLSDCYSLAALSAALQLIPRAWAEQARQCPRIMPMQVGQ
jgi:hypothetical protein